MQPNVLIVDPDVAFRGMLARALSTRGISVVEAGSVRQGQSIMQQCDPRVMVCAGGLKDGSPLHWIAQLRHDGRMTEVVYLSATVEDLVEAHDHRDELGLVGTLRKPLPLSTVVQCIQRQVSA